METGVKVMWRPPYGGTCIDTFYHASPWESRPAQLRRRGAVLFRLGVFASVSGAIFPAIALSLAYGVTIKPSKYPQSTAPPKSAI